MNRTRKSAGTQFIVLLAKQYLIMCQNHQIQWTMDLTQPFLKEALYANTCCGICLVPCIRLLRFPLRLSNPKQEKAHSGPKFLTNEVMCWIKCTFIVILAIPAKEITVNTSQEEMVWSWYCVMLNFKYYLLVACNLRFSTFSVHIYSGWWGS